MKTDAGIGVNNSYKMQVAINLCGSLKVIYAAILVRKVLKEYGKDKYIKTIRDVGYMLSDHE